MYSNLRNSATAIGLALATLSAGAASAADIDDPMIEDQIAKEQARWSGPYVGIAAAAGMTNTKLNAGGANLDGLGAEGVGIHGIVGYDQRFGRIVAGAFADFTYTDDFWATEFGAGGISGEINREYDWTAGARLGVLVNPNTMVYGLAGYSQMKVSAPTWNGAAISGTDSITFDGYTLGAGLESKSSDFMSWYVEGRWSEYNGEGSTIEAEPSEIKAMVGARLRLLTE